MASRTMTLETLIHHILHYERDDKKFCFILGAGTSVQSGIPTGGQLVKRWIKEMEAYMKVELDEWIAEQNFDRNNLASYYPQIYEKRFEIDKKEGYSYLEKIMEDKYPSCGYAFLAQFMVATKNNLVITTNFDSLLEYALYIYTNKRPLVVVHEALTSYINPLIKRPIIAKIHRDILFAPISTTRGTTTLSSGWKESLNELFKFYVSVIVGYGGNDGSLMNYLKSISPIDGGFFWCFREVDGKPEKRICDLVEYHNGFFLFPSMGLMK